MMQAIRPLRKQNFRHPDDVDAELDARRDFSMSPSFGTIDLDSMVVEAVSVVDYADANGELGSAYLKGEESAKQSALLSRRDRKLHPIHKDTPYGVRSRLLTIGETVEVLTKLYAKDPEHQYLGGKFLTSSAISVEESRKMYGIVNKCLELITLPPDNKDAYLGAVHCGEWTFGLDTLAVYDIAKNPEILISNPALIQAVPNPQVRKSFISMMTQMSAKEGDPRRTIWSANVLMLQGGQYTAPLVYNGTQDTSLLWKTIDTHPLTEPAAMLICYEK